LTDSTGFASAVGGDTPGGVRSGRWEPPQRLGQAAGCAWIQRAGCPMRRPI